MESYNKLDYNKADVTLRGLLKAIECTMPQSASEVKLTDITIPSKESIKMLAKELNNIAEITGHILACYNELVTKSDAVVNDLEHLISFSKNYKDEKKDIAEYVVNGKLPLEVQGISPDKYPDVLADVLATRRCIKDGLLVFKTINDKFSYMHQYINNLDRRLYQCYSVQSDGTRSGDKNPIMCNEDTAYNKIERR